MDIEKDDKDFDELLAEKRHKEQTGLLKGIATSLNKPQDNGVVDAIKESIAITAYELRTLRSENSDKQGAIVAKLAMMERRLSQIEGNGALAGASL